MARLFGFGQIIASEFPIPGARDVTSGNDTAPGVSITRDDSAGVASGAPPGFSREGDALRLTVPGIATYRCTASSISVTPCVSASIAEIGERLVAGALPATLWMQGRLMLHAAAVCMSDGGPALGISGRSGAGKSTLASALVAQGARLLADDSIAITPAGSEPIASGLSGGLFLRDSATTRRFRSLSPDRTIDMARLGALVILEEAAEETSLARLSSREALEAVLLHRHRPNAPALLGMRPEALLGCIELTRSIPVFAWRRPHPAGSCDFDEAKHLTRTLIAENIH